MAWTVSSHESPALCAAGSARRRRRRGERTAPPRSPGGAGGAAHLGGTGAAAARRRRRWRRGRQVERRGPGHLQPSPAPPSGRCRCRPPSARPAASRRAGRARRDGHRHRGRLAGQLRLADLQPRHVAASRGRRPAFFSCVLTSSAQSSVLARRRPCSAISRWLISTFGGLRHAQRLEELLDRRQARRGRHLHRVDPAVGCVPAARPRRTRRTGPPPWGWPSPSRRSAAASSPRPAARRGTA